MAACSAPWLTQTVEFVSRNGQINSHRRNRALPPTPAPTRCVLKILPVAVRDAIRTSAPFHEVTRISKTTTASGDVTDITMRANDHLTMMQISDTRHESSRNPISPRRERDALLFAPTSREAA